jgi:hypothetical protein
VRGRLLQHEILDLIGYRALQRYEILKRFAPSVHDAVVITLDELVHNGALEDDGVYVTVVR